MSMGSASVALVSAPTTARQKRPDFRRSYKSVGPGRRPTVTFESVMLLLAVCLIEQGFQACMTPTHHIDYLLGPGEVFGFAFG